MRRSCVLQQFMLSCLGLLAKAANKSGVNDGVLSQSAGSWEFLAADSAA